MQRGCIVATASAERFAEYARSGSDAWDATLDAFQDVRLFPQIGYSGDQNLYNGIAALFPHFFFNLGCEWNRQLGSWYMGGETMARGLAAAPEDALLRLHLAAAQ